MFDKLLGLWKKSRLSGRGLTKNPLMRALYRLGIRLAGRDIVNIEGHRMRFDEFFGMNINEDGGFDPDETAVVKRIIKPGFICLDVGANAGYYSLIFAKLSGPQGKVYAFEPEKRNYEMLIENVRANGYENIITEQSAVSDETGSLKLFLSDDNAGDHRIAANNDARQWQETRVTTIDEYLKDKTDRVDYVKTDIQGADFKALKGMAATLKKNPDIMIQSEFWPSVMVKAGDDPADFLQFLKEYGFTVYDILERRKDKAWQPADPSRMLSAYTAENEKATNIFAVRNKAAIQEVYP